MPVSVVSVGEFLSANFDELKIDTCFGCGCWWWLPRLHLRQERMRTGPAARSNRQCKREVRCGCMSSNVEPLEGKYFVCPLLVRGHCSRLLSRLAGKMVLPFTLSSHSLAPYARTHARTPSHPRTVYQQTKLVEFRKVHNFATHRASRLNFKVVVHVIHDGSTGKYV